MKIEILKSKLNFKLGFDRTIFFSDSVFAIAITLMAMDLKINGANRGLSNEELLQSLSNISNNIFSFLLSFLVIGYYWYIHHKMFRFINQIDVKVILLNFLLLLMIIIIPFTTSLIGTHPNELSTLIYSVNIFLISFLHYLIWIYSIKHKYFPTYNDDEKIEIEHYIKQVSKKSLINSIILLLVSFIIIIDFSYLQYFWFFIIIINWIFDYSYNKKIFIEYK